MAFSTSKIGIPAIGLLGSVLAAGLVISLAPITKATSQVLKSELISSNSKTSSYETLASASSTFIWPGILPATGWIANETFTPFFFNKSAISLTICWACDTAIPYPGTIITCSEFFIIKEPSVDPPDLTVLSVCVTAVEVLSSPKPPRITLINDLFIALHIM